MLTRPGDGEVLLTRHLKPVYVEGIVPAQGLQPPVRER
jgi:hypothetical protein